MKVSFADVMIPTTGALGLGVIKGGKLGPLGESIDKKAGGALKRAIKASERFDGDKGQTIEVMAPGGTKLSRIVLIGLGKPEDFDQKAAESVGGTFARRIGGTGETKAALAIDAAKATKVDGFKLAARAGYGARDRKSTRLNSSH